MATRPSHRNDLRPPFRRPSCAPEFDFEPASFQTREGKPRQGARECAVAVQFANVDRVGSFNERMWHIRSRMFRRVRRIALGKALRLARACVLFAKMRCSTVHGPWSRGEKPSPLELPELTKETSVSFGSSTDGGFLRIMPLSRSGWLIAGHTSD